MSKFAKLNVNELAALTTEEQATFDASIDVIIAEIKKKRAEGETCAKVEATVYGERPIIKYYLMKELIKIDLVAESMGPMPAAGFRVKWCDESILDIHRKRRLERVEATMPPQKRPKSEPVPFLESPEVSDL